MIESIIDKLSEKKRQIFWLVVVIVGVYLFSTWNIGGIVTFISFFNYGVNFLTKEFNLNMWLSRAIMIPISALMAWALAGMLSVISRRRRIKGTITVVLILTAICLAIFIGKDAMYHGLDYFSVFSGESLKNYYEQPGYVEVFPKSVQFHPIIGVKLDALTPEKREEFSRRKKELRYVPAVEKEKQKVEKRIYNPKDSAGNTRLFNGITGEPNFTYYISDGRMDLFPIDISRHPTLGCMLSPLTQQVMENFKKQSRERTEKQFLSQKKEWTDTGYYVLRGDLLEFFEPDGGGIDLEIMIGENGPHKIIDFNMNNQRKNKMTADSDGILHISSAEGGLGYKEVIITGLSVRIYK